MRGFTLVELLVVVAAAALLAALALPAYQAQWRNAQRADAVAALLRVELAQAGHRALHGLYSADLRALGQRSALVADGRWRVEIAAAHAEGYVARAVALDDALRRADAACATLTLEVDGLQTRRGPDARCWSR